MAARAIVKKIYENSRALSMIRAFVSPGIDRTANIRSYSEMVKVDGTSIKISSAVDDTEETTEAVNKIKAAVVCDDARKIQSFEEIEESGLKLLQSLQKFFKEQEEEEIFIDSHDVLKNYMKTIYELWNKKIEEEERKLLQEGWTHWRDSLCGTGLETCHSRLLLSIQHHCDSTGEEVIKFATASPHTGLISTTRLALQRLGPYGLPRESVMGVVCITTKDAFLLYNPTTGDTSPWIETTTTRKIYGEPRRQVESISLGFDRGSGVHKVICISSNVKKKSAPETENEHLVVEVLTVRDQTWTTGEHRWRKLEFVPHAFMDGERFVLVDGPLYLDGKLYWQHHYERRFESILKFDIEHEAFFEFPIPKFLIQEFLDYSRHMWSMLIEVDRKLAILKSTSDQETPSLWICHFLSDKIEWTEEKVPIPHAYVSRPGFSIEALKRTNLIFIQSRRCIYYYDRKTKESLSLRIPTSPIRDHFDWGRMIQL